MGNLRKVYYDTSEKQLVVRGEFSGSANTAEPVVPGGQDVTPLDLDDDLTGSAISVTNADVNSAAAIAYSKLAALTSANILVGNASNVATVTPITGDISIDNTGLTAIATSAVVNLDVNSAAAIDYSKLAALTSANILVGNASNVATVTPLTGVVSIDNTGLTGIVSGTFPVSGFPSGFMYPIAVEDGIYTDRDTMNLAGLASAIALATECITDYNAHCADVGQHLTAADTVNTYGGAVPTNLTELITCVTELLTDYDAHDSDAELGALWAYHDAQEALDHSLASVVAPTDLNECITRLNDFKAKFNPHDVDDTCHGTHTQHPIATANAALSTTIIISCPGAVIGDKVSWSILNDGTGNVTGLSSSTGTDYVDFVFSAEPQDDAIISYTVYKVCP